LLLELERVAGDGDAVIGGEESDQAEDQAAAGLDGTEAIEAGPGGAGDWGSLAELGASRCPRGRSRRLEWQGATLPGTRPSGVVGVLLFPWPLSHQGEEGPQSGSVGFGRVELHSGGKQS
jgi:hypothetical protein